MLGRRRLSTCLLALLVATLPVRLRAQCSSYSVSVTPKGSADTVPANATDTVYFTVTNTGSYDCADDYRITVSGSGSVSNVSLAHPNDTMLVVEWQAAKTVGVTFYIGAGASGTLYLTAQGYASDNGSINVASYSAGPPLDLVHAYLGPTRDVSKCVASCFDAVTSYAPPPYYSTDAPQSIHLVYRSSLAHPRGFVSVFAWDTTAGHPIRMSLQLKRPDGTRVPFLNGSTEMFFSCDSTGGHSYCSASSYAWLAAQFDASTDTTGAYPRTLMVRSYRADSSFSETDAAITVLVENESASPFGAGWTIAGYQRIHFGNDYSLVITDGNGSMGFFPLDSLYCFPCTYTSPTGDFSTVTYGARDSLGAIYRRRYPDGTTVGFKASGRMVYVQDAHGNTHQYDTLSNPLRAIRDVAGKYDSLGYDGRGKLAWIYDGRSTFVAIDTLGNLTQIMDAVGGIPFQGTYDSVHRLTHRIDRRGGAWGLTYDFANKLKADTAPAITTVHGTGERPVTRYVSLESALLDTVPGTWTNPTRALTGFTARAKVANPEGHTTAYVLDRFRQAAVIEEPLGRTTKANFDSLGRRTWDMAGGQGHQILYTWNGPNLTRWKDSVTGRTINYNYDTTANLNTLTYGDVDSVINVLTNDKKAIAKTRLGGATVSDTFTYVSTVGGRFYHACTVTGPSTSYRVTCKYPHADLFQNTDSVRTYGAPSLVPNLARTIYQYDAYGQRIRTINPNRDTTSTEYDLVGRVTRVIGPLHDATTYTYDSLYLTRVQDARGQVYTVWPNALGWPDSTADPAGRVTRFTYDSNGNQVTVVNRRAQTIQFTYDSLDQRRLMIVGTDTTKYFTDPLGWYRTAANRASVDTVRVDSAGRRAVEISCRVVSVSPAQTRCFVDSSFYETPRDVRTRLSVTAPGLWSTHTARYHYNPSLRLDTLTNFAGEAETFTYNSELRDSTRTFLALGSPPLTLTYGRPADVPNAQSSHSPWTVDGASLSFSDPTLTSQVGLAYTFDTLSRVTKQYHGDGARPDTVRGVLFDHASRLVQSGDTSYAWLSPACSLGMLGESCDHSQVSGTTVLRGASYVYDAVGNRMDSLTQSYAAVDSGNRLRRWANFRMDYDADGNLVRKRVLKTDTMKVSETDSLFWSALGRLDSIKVFDSTGTMLIGGCLQYGYDGWGRRVRKSNRGFPGSLTRFLWDGDNLIFDLDTTGLRRAYWTYYPGTNEPQSVAATTTSNGDTTFYYVTDALHNVVATLKANGSGVLVRTQYRYGPFGDSLAQAGAFPRGDYVRYKGALYDGIYHGSHFSLMGARYYDPDVGRFISEDPIGLKGGINQYAFAGNDPVNGYDPSGQFFFAPALLFAAKAAAAILLEHATLGAALITATEAVATTAAFASMRAGLADDFVGAFEKSFTSSTALQIAFIAFEGFGFVWKDHVDPCYWDTCRDQTLYLQGGTHGNSKGWWWMKFDGYVERVKWEPDSWWTGTGTVVAHYAGVFTRGAMHWVAQGIVYRSGYGIFNADPLQPCDCIVPFPPTP